MRSFHLKCFLFNLSFQRNWIFTFFERTAIPLNVKMIFIFAICHCLLLNPFCLCSSFSGFFFSIGKIRVRRLVWTNFFMDSTIYCLGDLNLVDCSQPKSCCIKEEMYLKAMMLPMGIVFFHGIMGKAFHGPRKLW